MDPSLFENIRADFFYVKISVKQKTPALGWGPERSGGKISIHEKIPIIKRQILQMKNNGTFCRSSYKTGGEF